MAEAMAQLNVRIPRSLKERGDATLALVGYTPVGIIRLLWERLAEGGHAYERVASVLTGQAQSAEAPSVQSKLQRSTSLFKEFGKELGFDISSFTPDPRSVHEIIEDIEWELMEGRGLV